VIVDKIDFETFEQLKKENRRLTEEVNKWKPLAYLVQLIARQEIEACKWFEEVLKADEKNVELLLKCTRLESELAAVKAAQSGEK
jgi:hypothetical protein